MNSIIDIKQECEFEAEEEAARKGGVHCAVRVSKEVYKELLRLSEATRNPISVIASQGLRFAFENMQLKEVKLYDLSFGGRNVTK